MPQSAHLKLRSRRIRRRATPRGMLRRFRRNKPQHAARPKSQRTTQIVHVDKFAYDVRNIVSILSSNVCPINLISNQTAQLTFENIDEICASPTADLAPAGKIHPIRLKTSRTQKRLFRQTISSHSSAFVRQKYQALAAIASHASSSSAIFLHAY